MGDIEKLKEERGSMECQLADAIAENMRLQTRCENAACAGPIEQPLFDAKLDNSVHGNDDHCDDAELEKDVDAVFEVKWHWWNERYWPVICLMNSSTPNYKSPLDQLFTACAGASLENEWPANKMQYEMRHCDGYTTQAAWICEAGHDGAPRWIGVVGWGTVQKSKQAVRLASLLVRSAVTSEDAIQHYIAYMEELAQSPEEADREKAIMHLTINRIRATCIFIDVQLPEPPWRQAALNWLWRMQETDELRQMLDAGRDQCNIDIPVAVLRWTQGRCSKDFRDKRPKRYVFQTAELLWSKDLDHSAIPRMRVVLKDCRFWSLDNRRLCLWKTLQSLTAEMVVARCTLFRDHRVMNSFGKKMDTTCDGMGIVCHRSR